MLEKLCQSFEKNILPGFSSHSKIFSPKRSGFKKFPKEVLKNAKQSAVMILLFPKADSHAFFLIERNKYKGVHSGQIGLPGGKKEEEDLDLHQTALRELSEELGVSKKIKTIGPLSEIYIPPSNFRVEPYVGIIDYTPKLIPDPHEVRSVIEVPLKELISAQIVSRPIKTGQKEFEVSCFLFSGHVVWGATAMILSEFRDILRMDSE